MSRRVTTISKHYCALLLLELSTFLQEFAERAAALFNELEQASLVEENDSFAYLLKPDIFKEEHNEIVVYKD